MSRDMSEVEQKLRDAYKRHAEATDAITQAKALADIIKYESILATAD